MPTINDVLAKITFPGFSSPDEATLKNTISNIYATSPTAQSMLNEIVTNNKPLEIKYVAGSLGASKDNYVQIDITTSSNLKYITPNGKAVEFSLKSVLAHELVHAIKGLSDADTVQGGVNVLNPGDFAGKTVDFANIIYTEMGIAKRLSYYGGGASLITNKDYTFGKAVNSAIMISGDYNVAIEKNISNTILKPHQTGSSDLIIGSENGHEFIAGDGVDFLYGNGGNDTLFGDAGNDSLFGGDNNDKLDGGADNDSLEGGDGADTYVGFNGNDTVNDDGADDVIEGAFGEFSGEAVEDGEGSGIYELNGAQITQSGADLVITLGSDKITLLNWEDGDYGITLEQKDKPDDDVENELQAGIGKMWNHPSPIALDINKSGGIETIALTSSTTYFDIDNDGFSENVEWLSSTDGWLVRDANANGKIDNQNELFGDGGGLKAYQKLAALNTNNTGTSANAITSADSAWNSLRVWIDSNSNGVSEAAELKTLSSLGITSLSLETAVGSLKSTFVRDGITYNAQDIFVAADQLDSWYKGLPSEVTSASLALPRSRGYGDVKSLHYAASASTTLTTKMQAVDTLALSGLDTYYAKLEAMIEEWTGTTSVVRTSINPLVDARHVAIMEKFSGMGAGSYMKSFTPGFTSFGTEHFTSLENGYSNLMSEFSVKFIAQTTLASVFGNPTYSFSDDALKFSISSTQILTNAKASSPVDSVDKNVYWSEIARILIEYATDFGMTPTTMQTAINTAAGYSVQINQPWNFYFIGSAGNDSLTGNSLNNYIEGLAGADTLQGGLGNDTINGGTGNDLIYGGDGNDSITDYDGNNTVYGDAGNDILRGGALSSTLSGGTGNDTIYSGIGNNLIYGDAGNDRLVGDSGKNTMSGGVGADTIVGGAGDETFRYANGDGDDVINKASTASTNDVLELTNIARGGVIFSAVSDSTLVSDPNSVKVNITGGGSILLTRHIDGTNAGRIASMKFSDGVIMTAAQIAQATAISGTTANDTINGSSSSEAILGFDGADSISGLAGNDSIYGGKGADILRGGLGADMLAGGDDSDTYRYTKGDGDDVVAEFGYNSTQDIMILENITRSEVSFISVDNDANGTMDSIRLVVSSGGSITLKDHLNQSAYNIVESAQFSDGTIMTAAQMIAATPVMGTAGDDTLFGNNGNNNISGLSGNDQLVGYDGNDSLSGDAGNDSIWGDIGNDIIDGGDGLDQLQGGDGADSIAGGSGNDNIWGDAGNDTIAGGVGIDYLVGGDSADRFVFNNGDIGVGTNADNISDFNRAQGDKIALLGYGLSSTGFKGTGAMAAGGAIEFNYTKVATYNYTLIRIDADNNGVSDQEIVLVGTQIDLTASDFQFL
jgi:Ca2+-binding RTX toxin-like protein